MVDRRDQTANFVHDPPSRSRNRKINSFRSLTKFKMCSKMCIFTCLLCLLSVTILLVPGKNLLFFKSHKKNDGEAFLPSRVLHENYSFSNMNKLHSQYCLDYVTRGLGSFPSLGWMVLFYTQPEVWMNEQEMSYFKEQEIRVLPIFFKGNRWFIDSVDHGYWAFFNLLLNGTERTPDANRSTWKYWSFKKNNFFPN